MFMNVYVRVCVRVQNKLPPWWSNTLSAMSLVQRRAIRGVMKLMTCCSCDRPPGPRLVSGAAVAGAVGARRSATGHTERETQGLSLF